MIRCDICGEGLSLSTAWKTKHSDMCVCVKCAYTVKAFHDYLISPNQEPILFRTLEDIMNNEEEVLCQIK